MRELHLPENATERDLDLAEQIARAFDTQALHVCWSERAGTSAPVRAPAVPARPLGVRLGEFAGGLAALWEAMVAGLEHRAGRPS
jgi:hypothetical protein